MTVPPKILRRKLSGFYGHPQGRRALLCLAFVWDQSGYGRLIDSFRPKGKYKVNDS